MTLAYTTCGVEDVVILSPAQVDALAIWLCSVHAYHDRMHTNISDETFSKQTSKDGYCNMCRDFAGAIVAEFTISVRDAL